MSEPKLSEHFETKDNLDSFTKAQLIAILRSDLRIDVNGMTFLSCPFYGLYLLQKILGYPLQFGDTAFPTFKK